jgi:hypothetical protein
MASATRIINDLLAEYLFDPARASDVNKARCGDFSGLSSAEAAAIQFLKENATDRTWLRVGVYDLVYGGK